jgi:very-short-patch-repair endonuclease
MDVFRFRDQLIEDYCGYIQSFVRIKDPEIQECVERSLKEGDLWPNPLIQLNPAFEPGGSVDELIAEGLLHQECRRIFRRKSSPNEDLGPIRFYRHQVAGIQAAASGDNYVLTTGTGSGKSLSYIVPIVNHVLRQGSGKGIQAIIVYPMNALANSQMGELKKFLHHGYPEGSPPVTFKRYTGQESDEERTQIIQNPPDIILTNYVMLELILTRPYEARLVEAAKGLRFLVLDELHTYRGRQGSDVAMLVRRLRDRCEAEFLQCVGTSATMASGGSIADQKAEVASVATMIFGNDVSPERIIGESLRRMTTSIDLEDTSTLQALKSSIGKWNDGEFPKTYIELQTDPLAAWIEHTFGLHEDEESGILVRSKPVAIQGDEGAAMALSKKIQVSSIEIENAIKRAFLIGNSITDDVGSPIFAFRLHQFVSKGESVFSSLEPRNCRHITSHPQPRVPGHPEKVLLPLAFCRECGQEYYVVKRVEEKEGQTTYKEMPFNYPLENEDGEAGYLYLDPEGDWPDDEAGLIQRLPDEWLEFKKDTVSIKYSRKKSLPKVVFISHDGKEGQGDLRALWLPAPFKFCIGCKVAYNVRARSDYGKLSTLGSEGRSTATTILALGTVSRLKSDPVLEEEAKKLLSFTDNRQDASLQAGHFNDFVLVSLVRAALHRALILAGDKGIGYQDLTSRVFEALSLPTELYSQNPNVKYAAKDAVDEALRQVLEYHLYRDLRRGWRVVAPNLEQCGLLKVGYLSLEDVCRDDEAWQNCHPNLITASPETRYQICKTLLDFIRRGLAIEVDALKPEYQERVQRQSSQNLIEPWSIDEGEKLERARVVQTQSGKSDEGDTVINLSPRGGFGQYLKRLDTFPKATPLSKTEDVEKTITDILKILVEPAGILSEVNREERGYQIKARAIRWFLGDGQEAFHDPIRVPHPPEQGLRTNEFFVRFYREATQQLIGLEAREHTAQVQSDEREEREKRFRCGDLPILFCSPTMELGVDIADLNVVNLRNVPPTPANYAQRSGRAGRSGQPALVYTYCATGSPHDSYYFKRSSLMVSGVVAPPQLDLSNEDMVRSHVHAVWIAEANLDLGKSLIDVLDVAGDSPSLKLLPSIVEALNSAVARNKAMRRAEKLLETVQADLESADWYSSDWLDRTLRSIPEQFQIACRRWKGLYMSALDQMERQNIIRRDASRRQDWPEADRLYNEAKQQLSLLTDTKSLVQSDFYSYRYFASEGFLPGYNFTRLPLSAYIPGRRRNRGRDDFLSRPRFLAISEFGPRAIVYHEGSRFIVNRVILPVDEVDEEGVRTLTRRAKVCEYCGYIHPLGKEPGPENCERCGTRLSRTYTNLFRMQNVVAKRRDRINCDEEERFRLGYQIISGVRFAEYGGVRSLKTGEIVSADGSPLANLQYGQAATLWRMNIGWSRTKKTDAMNGFTLDTERGYWASDKRLEEDDDDPVSPKVQKVIPYVEDRRNCLLIEPLGDLNEAIIASLQSALKVAIQVVYHLEDNEIATEGLPSLGERKVILLYEAAEGGAGVLRRLVEEADSISRIVTEALDICHFNPDSGEDRKRAPHVRENCAIACYDCLLSYYNQRDHEILNRHLVKDLLLRWKDSHTKISSGQDKRSDHLARLKNLCDSKLEKSWLDLLEEHQLRLPTHAQNLITECHTKPDFFYEDQSLTIYIDGPPHDFPERQSRDQDKQLALENHGFWILRFHHKDDWLKKLADHPEVFGKVVARP